MSYADLEGARRIAFAKSFESDGAVGRFILAIELTGVFVIAMTVAAKIGSSVVAWLI